MSEDEEPTYGDKRDEIVARAKKAGIKYVHAHTSSGSPDGPKLLFLFFPDHEASRSVSIDANSASAFCDLPFENFDILGSYRALYDREAGTVEAVVVPARRSAKLVKELIGLPGIENAPKQEKLTTSRDVPVEDLDDVDLDFISPSELEKLPNWRLPIREAPGGLKVEISPPSAKLKTFVAAGSIGSPVTIKVSGMPARPRAQVAEELESIASSILFELDVRFGIGLQLQYRQHDSIYRRRMRPDRVAEAPVKFPTIRYAKAPTMLYSYGRSANANPLQQYLAYYQAIEHYWPFFVRRDTISRVRNTLRHPQFNRESDADVDRLIAQAGRLAGRGPGELDQLKVTLEQSVERADIEAWLDTLLTSTKDYLLNSRGLSGIKPLNISPHDNRSITDQLADRVYTLRCRIVHAKDSRDYLEPLLPYSSEASKLEADLLLVHYLAQKVIVAGSNETF